MKRKNYKIKANWWVILKSAKELTKTYWGNIDYNYALFKVINSKKITAQGKFMLL